MMVTWWLPWHLWNLQPLSSADSGQSIHSWSARAGVFPSVTEAFLNSSVLLVGSLVIGVLTGERLAGFGTLTQGMFYGILTFFLLDMGLVAASRIKELQKTGVFLIGFAIMIPIVNAGIGLDCEIYRNAPGNALCLQSCASASILPFPPPCG